MTRPARSAMDQAATWVLKLLGDMGIRPSRWQMIGRHADCHLRVDDELVDLFQVMTFEVPAGYWWVLDLKSTNGTWHTQFGAKSQLQTAVWVRIRPGDTLTMGRTDLCWAVPQAQPANGTADV